MVEWRFRQNSGIFQNSCTYLASEQPLLVSWPPPSCPGGEMWRMVRYPDPPDLPLSYQLQITWDSETSDRVDMRLDSTRHAD